jgi:hypothetical protein
MPNNYYAQLIIDRHRIVLSCSALQRRVRVPSEVREVILEDMRKHLTGYVKLRNMYILFRDKHCKIRARFRASHRRP